MSLPGFEISDVLSINDKDYSITFGLYFSVEWVEPRLNLSHDVWGGSEYTESLVPGLPQTLHFILNRKTKCKLATQNTKRVKCAFSV